MPELPEVESVRRDLVRARLCAPVRSIWRSPYPLRTGTHWRQENLAVLQGAVPGSVGRRGKHLVWPFELHGERLGLVVHLGMTGRLLLANPEVPRAAHTHVELEFEDGRQVRLVDPRRFGGMRAGEWSTMLGEPPLEGMGPEPLGRAFHGESLAQRVGSSRRIVRDVLLDQRVVAGVGNIYALEALFEAGIHPLVRAYRLRESAWNRLATAVRSVLRQGIENGGTTFRDFRGATGKAGNNRAALAVYGRRGEACRRCGTALEGFSVGGRSGVFCPNDQARPRGVVR